MAVDPIDGSVPSGWLWLLTCERAVGAGLPAFGAEGRRTWVCRDTVPESVNAAPNCSLAVPARNCAGAGEAHRVGAMTCQLTWPQTIPWNETRITWNLLWVPPKTTVNVISDGQYWDGQSCLAVWPVGAAWSRGKLLEGALGPNLSPPHFLLDKKLGCRNHVWLTENDHRDYVVCTAGLRAVLRSAGLASCRVPQIL